MDVLPYCIRQSCLLSDTILGRQCMASCFFLLKAFEEVIVYLDSIKVSNSQFGESCKKLDIIDLIANKLYVTTMTAVQLRILRSDEFIT